MEMFAAWWKLSVVNFFFSWQLKQLTRNSHLAFLKVLILIEMMLSGNYSSSHIKSVKENHLGIFHVLSQIPFNAMCTTDYCILSWNQFFSALLLLNCVQLKSDDVCMMLTVCFWLILTRLFLFVDIFNPIRVWKWKEGLESDFWGFKAYCDIQGGLLTF